MEHFSALVAALDSAVQDARDNRFVPPDVAHERIRTMYTWENVARRTEKVSWVYQQILLVSLRFVYPAPERDARDWTWKIPKWWRSPTEIYFVIGCRRRMKIEIKKQAIREHYSIFGEKFLTVYRLEVDER